MQLPFQNKALRIGFITLTLIVIRGLVLGEVICEL